MPRALALSALIGVNQRFALLIGLLVAPGALGACGRGGALAPDGHPGGARGSSLAFDLRAHLLATGEGSLSEGVPSGVPSHWDWVTAATSTRTAPPEGAHSHANYWGAVFRGLNDAPALNSWIQIRNCSMWFLTHDERAWTEAGASSELGGTTFSPSYAAGGPAPLVLEMLPNGVNVVPAAGFIWHFWQANGYQPTPEGVREILTNCQSRLVLRGSGTDDRAQADYLIHTGADFRDPSDPSCANDNFICPSWGVSRLERITSAWRNHTFHSLTQADLEAMVPLPPASVFALPSE